MIPAILAAPVAESVVGSVLGSVGGTLAGLFSSPSKSAPTSSVSSSFAPLLTRAAEQAHNAALSSPMGTMSSSELGGMSGTDLRTWMLGLTGKHVHAVDSQGHTVSGVVEGYSQTSGTLGLNINGHLVSLSSLSQISWSPAIHNR